MTRLLTILTVRTASDRLPGKALAPVKGRNRQRKIEELPLIVWIIRRLRELPGALVLATTTEKSDNDLAKVAKAEGIEVIRGDRDNVIGRMQAVIETGQYPDTGLVFRALGDCPFISRSLVTHAARQIVRNKADAFAWAISPNVFPVYGSREFPLSLNAWRKIVRHSKDIEHPDKYFHDNREKFNILYHEAPHNVYFRPYRLEVDYQEDLDLIREIAQEVGMLAPLKDVIQFLDRFPRLAQINTEQTEKTGPLSLKTYSNAKRGQWLKQMQGQPVMGWNGEWVQPPDKRASPVFCNCGHLVGHGWQGRLYLTDGDIINSGVPSCRRCKLLVRTWKKAL